jgi:hypothetical protein
MENKKDLSINTVFDVLSNPRRRILLRYLSQHGETDVQDLVYEVAAREYGTETAAVTTDQHKRVYVSLYQTHVPKLCGLGLVNHDDERGTVRLTDRAQLVERYLATRPPATPRWQVVYLAAALVGLIFIAAVANGWSMFSTFSEELALLLVICGFGLLTVAHLFVPD